MSGASGLQKLTGLFSPNTVKNTFGGLMGGKDSPAPQPVPIAPTEDPSAAAARDAEARRAQTDRGGRGSTIAAGLALEEEDQQSRGLFKAKPRKAAASAILG